MQAKYRLGAAGDSDIFVAYKLKQGD